jgi:hypothetical protein
VKGHRRYVPHDSAVVRDLWDEQRARSKLEHAAVFQRRRPGDSNRRRITSICDASR